MPHLEELPQELFDLVLEELRPSDLPNLRLTSRTCAAKVLDRYATVHFTDCTITCNADKHELVYLLKTFLEIAHTKIFVSKMRSLTFNFSADFENAEDCYTPLDWMIDEGMKAVFAAISQQTSLKHIRVTSASMPINDDGRKLCKQTRPLNLITSALSSSGLEVAELTLGGTGNWNETQWSLPYFKLDHIDLRNFGDVLQTVTVLRLSVWDPEENYCDDPSEIIFNFVDMLSKAPQLKVLALHDTTGPLCDYKYSTALDFTWTVDLEESGFPVLEILEVNGWPDIGGVVEFTKKFQLKKLILTDVIFNGFKEWTQSGNVVDDSKSVWEHFGKWNPNLLLEADDDTKSVWADANW